MRSLLAFLVLVAAVLLAWQLDQVQPLKLRPRAGSDTLVSPYLDVSLAIESGLPLDGVYFSSTTKSIIDPGLRERLHGVHILTLAFASGECGSEHWGGVQAQGLTKSILEPLQQAGVKYVISTGGSNAAFTCTSPQGMDAFVQRYLSPQLLGFDFNIEGQPSREDIFALAHQVAAAVARHPELRWSFTVAASAGNRTQHLNNTGQWVLQALQAEGLEQVHINLMVMNFGPAQSSNCMVVGERCDMAGSAIEVVRNVSSRYQVPLARLDLTPMIGHNDVADNVFMLDDARRLAAFARDEGLGGLHFWSLNRDTPCGGAAGLQASALCHGLPDAGKLAFTQAFSAAATSR